jgi:hypothetical protein
MNAAVRAALRRFCSYPGLVGAVLILALAGAVPLASGDPGPITVTVMAGQDTVAAGGLVHYTATLHNAGGAATVPTVEAQLDSGLAYVKYSSFPQVDDDQQAPDLSTLDWSNVSIAAGGTTTLQFEATAPIETGAYQVSVGPATGEAGTGLVAGSAQVTVAATVPGTVVLQPTDDTYVDVGDPSTSHGSLTNFDSYGSIPEQSPHSSACCSGGDRYGLLKFDLSSVAIPAGDTITSAEVRLVSSGGYSFNGDDSQHLLLTGNNWNETDAEYGSPGTLPTGFVGPDNQTPATTAGELGHDFIYYGGAVPDTDQVHLFPSPVTNSGGQLDGVAGALTSAVAARAGSSALSLEVFNANATGSAGASVPGYWVSFHSKETTNQNLRPELIITYGTAGCTPSAHQVTLYTGTNYTGSCAVYDLGAHSDLTAGGGGIPDNSAASIRVGPGTAAVVHQQPAFGGLSNNSWESVTSNTPDLSQLTYHDLQSPPDNPGGTLDDSISSLWVMDTSCTPAADQVAVYDGKNQTGACVLVNAGSYGDTVSAGLPNDFAGSLEVGTDASIDLWVDDGFSGTECAYGASSQPASLCFGDDEMSSLIVGEGATNDSWTRAEPIQLDGDAAGDFGDGSTSGSIDVSGQARWYRFNVTPGGSVQVDLTGLPANDDVALFSDIGQAFNTISSTSDLQTVSAEFGSNAFSPSVFSPSVFSPSVFSPSVFSPSVFSPSVFSPSVFSPSVFSPSVFSPSVFSPSVFSPSVFSPSVFSPSVFSPDEADYEGAQVRSLIGISANDGTAPEHVTADVWNNTGSFYIRVNGRNGTYAPNMPFSLHVHEDAGTCGGVVTDSDVPLLDETPSSSSLETLILTDYGRFGDAAGLGTMETDLSTFASNSNVNGAVLDLSQVSPRVAALEAQADAHTDCVYAENLAAGAIRDVVTSYRAANPTLKYVVIAGDDSIVPFFRYPDTAGIGPESNYVPPVLDTTASAASLESNDVLSEDAYGAKTVLHVQGIDIPVPDLPVGRLVETPTEISGLLDAYLGLPGGTVPTPTSSLVTGYDFMTSGANAVENNLSAGLGAGAANDTLITNDGVAPTDTGAPPNHSWTADQLRTDLLGKRHSLIFLAGHFSANNTLAADYSTTMNAAELAASNVDLKNSIVFSAGCHSGYDIVGRDAVPGVTQTLDWTEAFAQKQATLIAGTGYQYGDTDFLAYSEELYANFAQALRTGTGPVAVGSALEQAKLAYLQGTPNLQGIDVKSLLEATLYGLPMLSVNLPAGRINPPANTSIVSSTSPFGGNPGDALGLSYKDLTLTPTLATNTVPLVDQNNNPAGNATYLSGPDGVDSNPAAPTLPLATYSVGVGGIVLRGIGFRGGSYADTNGITPLTGAPATELNNPHSPFVSSAFFPGRLWNVNYFSGLASGGTGTELMLTPAQYKSDAPNSLTDIQRAFSSVSVRLFYSGDTKPSSGGNTPALAAAPTISRVDASSASGTVTFAAHVVGDPAAGIQEVWVTYTGVTPGTWSSVELTQDPTDSTLWTGELSGLSDAQIAALRFIVQGANGVGLVSLDDNEGAYYQVDQIPPALQNEATLSPTTVQLDAPPSGGSFGSSVAVSASLTLSAGAIPLAGQPLTFTVGGSSVTANTGANGVATAQLPLVDVPDGGYTLAVAYNGDGTRGSSGDASTSFTIAKLPSAMTLTGGGGTVLDGAATGISTVLTGKGVGLAQRTVAFVLTPTGGGTPIVQTRITDLNGRASLGIVTQPLAGAYSVQAFFAGGAPITLPDDAEYTAASSPSATVTVTAAAVLSISRVGASPTNAASVSWAVTFNEVVTGVGTSNFSLVKTGLTGGSITGITGTGSSYVVTANTGTGDGTLGLNLTNVAGITDGAGGPVAPFVGQLYTIDRTVPAATITFPVTGGFYRTATYNGACTPTGICGTATDPSGVKSVKISIRKTGGNYWNGSAFTAATETFVTATLSAPGAQTTAWGYPLSIPADGGYTVHVQATDLVGNTQTGTQYAATSTFTIDTVSPTISFVGNKATYTVSDTVAITCKAADAAPSSGLATNPCSTFSISAPAWTFKPGANTVPSTPLLAVDSAGNRSAGATVTFTVSVTTATLGQLALQFVQSSTKYASLTSAQKQAVNVATTLISNGLSVIVPKLSPSARAKVLAAYATGLQSLVNQGWLTSTQASILETYAAAL